MFNMHRRQHSYHYEYCRFSNYIIVAYIISNCYYSFMQNIQKLNGKKCVINLKICLKEMEPHIKNVKPLWNGRDSKNFSLRAREIWSLWLICAVVRTTTNKQVTFCEDNDRDGILVDMDADEWIKVENVSAMNFPNTNLPLGEERIINAIEDKIKSCIVQNDLVLVVFFDGAKLFFPNKIAKAVYGRHNFINIYLVGLVSQENNKYLYSVSELFPDFAEVHLIEINENWTNYTVQKYQ